MPAVTEGRSPGRQRRGGDDSLRCSAPTGRRSGEVLNALQWMILGTGTPA
ncbi:MAG: hypothetical protein OXG81_02750 [Acidobacteria bacterium]|nr:hypothetical protein [Acidobacteriota bacterium]